MQERRRSRLETTTMMKRPKTSLHVILRLSRMPHARSAETARQSHARARSPGIKEKNRVAN